MARILPTPAGGPGRPVPPRLRRFTLLLLPALGACWGCAPPAYAAAPGGGGTGGIRRAARPPEPAGVPAPPLDPALDGPRRRIVEIARGHLGARYAGDCSSFVRRVMREAEVELGPLTPARSMSESLHLASRPVARPAPGDLVFFHDTYDRNRDGRLGDRWTHVALVEAVEGDRVWILHRGGKGILRLRMNLARPSDAAENDPVRFPNGNDPPGTRYLTGELFAGYGAVID